MGGMQPDQGAGDQDHGLALCRIQPIKWPGATHPALETRNLGTIVINQQYSGMNAYLQSKVYAEPGRSDTRTQSAISVLGAGRVAPGPWAPILAGRSRRIPTCKSGTGASGPIPDERGWHWAQEAQSWCTGQESSSPRIQGPIMGRKLDPAHRRLPTSSGPQDQKVEHLCTSRKFGMEAA